MLYAKSHYDKCTAIARHDSQVPDNEGVRKRPMIVVYELAIADGPRINPGSHALTLLICIIDGISLSKQAGRCWLRVPDKDSRLFNMRHKVRLKCDPTTLQFVPYQISAAQVETNILRVAV